MKYIRIVSEIIMIIIVLPFVLCVLVYDYFFKCKHKQIEEYGDYYYCCVKCGKEMSSEQYQKQFNREEK
jgi:hypothetical protein